MTTKAEQARERDFSCTYCGPGACATWDVVTDDGVLFVCDKHNHEVELLKGYRPRQPPERSGNYGDFVRQFQCYPHH